MAAPDDLAKLIAGLTENSQALSIPPLEDSLSPSVPVISDTEIEVDDLYNKIAWGTEKTDLLDRLRFRMADDAVARVAFLEDELTRTHVHYHRYYHLCLGSNCPACQYSQPKPRYAAYILVYALNGDGQLIVPLNFSLKCFIFGRDKYSILSRIRHEWGDLRKIDLNIRCEVARYQKMAISPARECAYQSDPAIVEQVLDLYKKERVDPRDMLGVYLPPSRLQAHYRNYVAPTYETTSDTTSNATLDPQIQALLSKL
jgi:hypothetical protein